MNSKLFFYSIKHFYGGGGLGTTGIRMKHTFFENFYAEEIEQKPIIKLVDKILEAKKENPEVDTSAWEKEIDQLVYKLYNLTEEEIKIVEGE
jgi:hypothetical protein